MSEEQNDKSNRRYVAKIKNIDGPYGVFQKIFIDNLNFENKDGTPNKYYKGALIWADQETGKNYQVKQMSVFVPREGMSEENAKRGFTCFITLNLDDNYEVTVLA